MVQQSAHLAHIKLFSMSAFAQLCVSFKTDVCVCVCACECEETQVAREMRFRILSLILTTWQASVQTVVQSELWSLSPKRLLGFEPSTG